MRTLNLILKRLIDIVLSLIGLIIVSPIFVIVPIIIKITMPGPVFFIQERVGKDKKVFKIIKFRTMKVDNEAERNFDFSKDKERVTRTGKFLRRYKIDEIPQLINVLKGDMSLVGPRPTIKKQVDKYGDYELQRLKMKPGMTGLAQVSGGTKLSWQERIKIDIYYIDSFSILLDIKILIKTLGVVLFGESISNKKENINN